MSAYVSIRQIIQAKLPVVESFGMVSDHRKTDAYADQCDVC